MQKGNTADHVKTTCMALLRVAEASGAKMLGDMTAAKLRAYLAHCRESKPAKDRMGKLMLNSEGKTVMRAGVSATRHNAIRTAWGTFVRWCIQEHRMYENPVVNVPRLNEQTDRRHQRRALDEAEVRALLASAEKGPHLAGMTGAERLLIYRTAVETGLRQNELRTLTRGCLDLEGLTITVRAGYSKHRREDVVPIRAELAEALREWVAHMATAAKVFNIPNRSKMIRAFRADLAAAGIAGRDAEGRVVDFHAAGRHSFISQLAAGGVHPKTAQVLARHSTITLTMDRYTHTLRGAEAAALGVLPNYSTPDATKAKRTGTDDAPTGGAPTPGRVSGAATGPSSSASEQQSERGAITAPPETGGETGGARGGKPIPPETYRDNEGGEASTAKSPGNVGFPKPALLYSGLAGVAELADALDSKSSIRKDVWVRLPPPALNLGSVSCAGFSSFCGWTTGGRRRGCRIRVRRCGAPVRNCSGGVRVRHRCPSSAGLPECTTAECGRPSG